MAKLFVHGKVTATWAGRRLTAELGSAQDVADTALELLIEELGTERAKSYMERRLMLYREDYKGAGRDDGKSKR